MRSARVLRACPQPMHIASVLNMCARHVYEACALCVNARHFAPRPEHGTCAWHARSVCALDECTLLPLTHHVHSTREYTCAHGACIRYVGSTYAYSTCAHMWAPRVPRAGVLSMCALCVHSAHELSMCPQHVSWHVRWHMSTRCERSACVRHVRLACVFSACAEQVGSARARSACTRL